MATESPTRRRREIALRVIALAISLGVLYVFLPTLGEFFDQWPRLRDLEPLWMAAAIVLEGGSFACTWWLFAIALQSRNWFAMATSQLAGNALSRVVPAGAAAGATLQYRMLAASGINAAAAGAALTAATLLQLATLAALAIAFVGPRAANEP
mgnify:CR=1 FL=1